MNRLEIEADGISIIVRREKDGVALVINRDEPLYISHSTACCIGSALLEMSVEEDEE